MNSKIEKLELSQVKITLELNKDEWKEMIVQAYNKTKGKYAVQGFRKGKAPMKVLTNAYGEGLFYEDALDLAFEKYYVSFLNEHEEIFTVGQPELDVENLSEEGVTIIATVAVKPEFELGQYKGIKFEKVEYNVKDEDIDAEIEKMREQAGTMVEVTRVAENGDTANIDFEGFVDGVAFNGGKGEGYDLVLGSKSFIPGFEDGVVGMAVGEEKDVDVSFPAEYGEPTLAGKPAVFKVKVNSLKVKELPEVDDEFVKDVSEFDTVDALKADITVKLVKANAEKADYEMENKIVETICENTEILIPEAMISSHIDSMVRDFEMRLMYQGMKLDDYLGYIGKNREDFRADFKDEANKQVKAQLVIDKILEAEKIEATTEEVDAKIAEIAEKSSKTVEEYKKTMQPQQISYFSRQIIVEKLFNFLKEANTIA